jgi:hypothetical protein
MAIISRAQFQHIIRASLELERAQTDGQILTPEQFNPASQSFTSLTTVPGTQFYAKQITLASDEVIDLSSWTDTEGETKDSDGLKVQVFRAQCDDGNTGDITIQGGDSDPYELFGSGLSVEIPPGGSQINYFADQLADVGLTSGVTATDIKVSGTTGDVVDIEMVIG